MPTLPPDGPATALLLDLAKRHDATVGGSFLCQDDDGHVRNAFFLATPKGWPLRGYIQRNTDRITHRAPPFARLMGCPVVDANHGGHFRCPAPLLRAPYESDYQGGSIVCDARGEVLAYRAREQGARVVVADVQPGRIPVTEPIPDWFWILELDPVTEYLGWRLQGWHGRRWYRRHGAG